ncbi:glutathione S-transferase family protein [Oceanospirillum sanctuarii]|uniref:glutathione S-transferase family protein n=1 Tax=Oceanospirillum sanctuarii TaxID=1434821 RepID=UPI0015938073|nr:glutathione S-transferase family protein [Oceanospirillum sanctuarii]
MKLVGSLPSPYVRRLRLWLEGHHYEFLPLDIYSEAGRAELETYTPAMKVPMLVDEEHSVYDSRIIQRYLNQKLKKEQLSWEDENLMSLIDCLQESFIILLMSHRSGIDTSDDRLILNLQKERIARTMPVLEQATKDGDFSQWQYPAICLFTLLDWIQFRELFDLKDYPALASFHKAQLDKAIVQETDPRKIN